MNEKTKILEMLEQGKINAEEAAKLLAAVAEGKKKDVSSKIVESVMDGVSSVVEAIPDSVSSAFSFSSGGEKGVKAEKGDDVLIKCVGSSITLSKHGDNELKVNSESGIIRTKRDDSSVISKLVGAQADISYPSGFPVFVKDVGGSVKGVCPQEFSLKQVGGSAKLSLDVIKDVQIVAKGGSITLLLGECDFSFDISAPDGTIDFDIPAKFEIKKEERVKGKVKKGKGKLVVKVTSGDVSVIPKKEGENK